MRAVVERAVESRGISMDQKSARDNPVADGSAPGLSTEPIEPSGAPIGTGY
jgi:hypothetical protein